LIKIEYIKKMNSVTINVGGKNMVTYKSTLEQLEYFRNILERWNKTDNIFVDYDPDLFIHLLNKLRDNNYTMPNNDNIKSMCEFFGLSLNMNNVPSPIIYKKIIMNLSSRIELDPKIIVDISLRISHTNEHNFFIDSTNSFGILDACGYDDYATYFRIDKKQTYFVLRNKYVELLRRQNTNIYIYIKTLGISHDNQTPNIIIRTTKEL
jgi:hypothetical protein